MAQFKYNNGQITDIIIEKKHDHTKLFVSVILELDDDSTKVAGHTIINLNGNLSIEDVQFEDHQLDYSFVLYNKRLVVIVNASKFMVKKKEVKNAVTGLKCTVRIEAGNELIKEYVLDDSANPEYNSIFNYLFNFKAE